MGAPTKTECEDKSGAENPGAKHKVRAHKTRAQYARTIAQYAHVLCAVNVYAHTSLTY